MASLRRETVSDPAHAPAAAAEHESSLGTYYAIFAALMVLLVLTVAAAFIPHYPQFPYLGITIALAIACIKAALVIYYFMHVREASRLTKVFVLASFMWLAIMFIFTTADYASRHWLPYSSGWNNRSLTPTDNPSR